MRNVWGVAALAVYVGCIFGANWAGQKYGIVNIGFGLSGPAGLYFVGLSFGARDIVRETLGKWPTFIGVIVGAALSFLVAPSFAMASGVAFLVSEMADYAVYEPLRQREWGLAVIASNIAGAVLDSIIFLWLAFGWDSVGSFWFGQTVGKAYMIAPAIAAMWLWRRVDLPQRVRTPGIVRTS